MIEANGILDDLLGLFGIEWFVVRKETAGLREIGFGLGIVAAIDGIVGTLEEAKFTVLNELD